MALKSLQLHLVITLLFLGCISVSAQETTPKPETLQQTNDEAIYTSVEVKPDFPGGMAQFYAYVQKNFKIPKKFKGKTKIITRFVVEKDGNLSDIKILKGGESGLGEEAIRLLESSPLWTPAEQNGKPVRVLYSMPISIQ